MVFPTSYHGFTTTSPIIMIARSPSRSARTYSALDRWLLSSLKNTCCFAPYSGRLVFAPAAKFMYNFYVSTSLRHDLRGAGCRGDGSDGVGIY